MNTAPLCLVGDYGESALRKVLSRLERVKKVKDGWIASCPVRSHGKGNGDVNPSLSIRPGNTGKVLLHCHAGCRLEDILTGMQLTVADLHERTVREEIAATYDYRDEQEELLYQVIRYLPKGFRQRRPDGKGGWIRNLGNTRRVPYRLPELLSADPQRPVFICEGEKDVENLVRLGLVATTNSGGAGKWRAEFSKALQNRTVVILPHNDDPGREHAWKVGRSLLGVARSVKVVEIPGLAAGGDVSDMLAGGGTREDLERLVAEAPEWSEESNGPEGLPTIIVNHRPMRDVTSEAMGALVARNTPPRLFHRGGSLCRVRRDERGRPIVETLTDHALRGEMDRAANFRKETKNGEAPVPPPAQVVQDAASLPGWEAFPTLDAIIQAPAIREDGSIIRTPGYDRVTCLYLSPSGNVAIPDIPDVPRPSDVEAALSVIGEVLRDFNFVDDASKANAVGLLLTPVLRPAIRGPVPLAVIDAPVKGTGKTLLAEVAATIAVARGELMGAPSNEEEWRKQITAVLVEGSPVVILDNVRGVIRSAHLERALTSEFVADRILGLSKMVRLPQRATWIVTANNAAIGGDLSRRCYWIRMDARMARPWERTEFLHPELLTWVRENRGPLLGALLTLARSWFATGCPRGDSHQLGKFEGWCEVVGGILRHVGIRGFLGNLTAMYDALDEGSTQWEAFLRAWREMHPDRAMTVSELVERMASDSDPGIEGNRLWASLPDELIDGREWGSDRKGRTSFAKRLGKALSRKKDVRYGSDNLRLVKVGEDRHRGVVRWRVVCDAG